MTYEEKLRAAFDYAERQTKASGARTKYHVLVAKEVRKGNVIVNELRRDEHGHPKTIVLSEKGAQRALRNGFELAEKPAGLPKGVEPASPSEEAPKRAAATTRTRKTSR